MGRGDPVDSHQVCKKRMFVGGWERNDFLLIHALAQTISPGPTVSPLNGEEFSGSEAERAGEFLPELPAAQLLCNARQYEL